MQKIHPTCALPLQAAFIQLLEAEWQKAVAEAVVRADVDVIVNFKDPSYSAEAGGFHPVEVFIQRDGRILYITDFAYVGRPPYEELVKELDFDFGLGLFGQFGHDYPIAEAEELFGIFQANFCSYFAMGAFTVTVSEN